MIPLSVENNPVKMIRATATAGSDATWCGAEHGIRVQEEREEERKPQAPKRGPHQFGWRVSFPGRPQKSTVGADTDSDVAEVSSETWVGRQE